MHCRSLGSESGVKKIPALLYLGNAQKSRQFGSLKTSSFFTRPNLEVICHLHPGMGISTEGRFSHIFIFQKLQRFLVKSKASHHGKIIFKKEISKGNSCVWNSLLRTTRRQMRIRRNSYKMCGWHYDRNVKTWPWQLKQRMGKLAPT